MARPRRHGERHPGADLSDADALGHGRLRGQLAAAAAKRETELRTAFRHAGVDALELSTGDDLVDDLGRVAEAIEIGRIGADQAGCDAGLAERLKKAEPTLPGGVRAVLAENLLAAMLDPNASRRT